MVNKKLKPGIWGDPPSYRDRLMPLPMRPAAGQGHRALPWGPVVLSLGRLLAPIGLPVVCFWACRAAGRDCLSIPSTRVSAAYCVLLRRACQRALRGTLGPTAGPALRCPAGTRAFHTGRLAASGTGAKAGGVAHCADCGKPVAQHGEAAATLESFTAASKCAI
jgi:hypothetical protein